MSSGRQKNNLSINRSPRENAAERSIRSFSDDCRHHTHVRSSSLVDDRQSNSSLHAVVGVFFANTAVVRYRVTDGDGGCGDDDDAPFMVSRMMLARVAGDTYVAKKQTDFRATSNETLRARRKPAVGTNGNRRANNTSTGSSARGTSDGRPDRRRRQAFTHRRRRRWKFALSATCRSGLTMGDTAPPSSPPRRVPFGCRRGQVQALLRALPLQRRIMHAYRFPTTKRFHATV